MKPSYAITELPDYSGEKYIYINKNKPSFTEEENLRKMYAKLLANSMNKENTEQVHPAFIQVLNEMSSFDAKLLSAICKIDDNIPIAEIKFIWDNNFIQRILPHYFCPLFDEFDDKIATSASIENLSRLNLINLSLTDKLNNNI